MRKVTAVSIIITMSLIFSSLLGGCIVLPTPQPEPTPPTPTPTPTPTPEPEPEPEPTPEPDVVAPFEDIMWLLEAYGDRGSLKPVIGDTDITAEFKSDNNTVMGSGGCNTYFADYETEDDVITVIPPIVSTEIACDPPIMNQEEEYFDLLENAETFLIHNDKFIISSSSNREMVFIEKAAEEEEEEEEEEIPPIEDMTWELEAYGERGSLEDPVENSKITAEFRSGDGRVGGSAGCNSYSADYEIDGNEITIIPPINSTMMLCFPSSVMDQEQEFFDLLKTTETFLVHNDKLIISCEDNRELVFVEEIPSIEDITWELEAYGERGSLEDPVENSKITAEFRSADGRVGGSAGCNSYSADYEIDGNEISIIPPITATMMLCFPSSVMEQEQEFFNLLKTTETFKVEDDKLIISCEDDMELVFVEE